jgi:peptidoglycan/LPS O-acetylase OafA/YrhL
VRWTRLTLVITEAFVALSAFGAGAMFMAAPSGRLMGMTEATLARSPFRNYLVPGIVLFAVVGGTQALAAWAEIQRWPRAGWLSVVAGTVLAGWIAVQAAMIGLGHPMQPSLFVVGVVIAGLGWRRRVPRRSDVAGRQSGR